MNPTKTTPGVQPFDPKRYLGVVTQVSGAIIKLAFPHSAFSETSEDDQPVSVGEYIVVEHGKLGIVGQLSEVSACLEDPITDSDQDHPNCLGVFGSAELMASVDMSSLRVSPGVVSFPRIGNAVYKADPKLVQMVVECRFSIDHSAKLLMVDLGHLHDANKTHVQVTPEKLFGRHCAIVGATGSGKSWTVARLVERAGQHKAKIILFDATGEYHELSRNMQHVYLGTDPDPLPGSREVSVPYYHLMESDLFAVFSPSGASQAPKLRAAMKSLKLARLVPNLAPDGTVVKADRSKVQYEREYRAHIAELEEPYASFDISLLSRQIENECVNPQRSAVEPLVWGAYNSTDYSQCVPLINRIQDIAASPNLAPIFNPKDRRSLFNEINAFYRDKNLSVLRVSLKHLSFEYNSREIVLNAVGRYLLELARKEYFRRQPVVVVLDEAHQFLNARLEGKDGAFPLDSFALIAKEGRKYAITLCLATQRPRDIPDGVMSQMGSLIVHRLINDQDRAVIESAAADLDAATSAAIPSLPPGDAIIIGIDFPIPLSITVSPPEAKPDSRGPDYQTCWK